MAVVAGAVRWATHRRGPLAGALLALAAGTALTGGALRGVHLDATCCDVVVHPVQAAVEVTVVLVITLALPRSRSTRLWSLGLLLPMAWLAQQVLDRVLYGTGFI